MALTGLQIYKLLPQTNCKECNFRTCLAFAMKLAAKQADLSACPHVSAESKTQLEAASQPPIRLITVSSDGRKVEAGNEIVMFRHEKTFYHPAGLFIRLRDDQPLDELGALAKKIGEYEVDVTFPKRAHNPLLIAAGLPDKTTPIPWWENHILSLRFR